MQNITFNIKKLTNITFNKLKISIREWQWLIIFKSKRNNGKYRLN